MKMDAEPMETGQVTGDASVCKPSGSGLNTVKGKKRKGLLSDMALLVDTLGEFMKITDDSFNSLANRMVLEPEVKVARTSLNDIMKRIPRLSLQDKLKVSDELVQDTKRLEFFLTLPDDEQEEYVRMLLDGNLGPLA
ncbi:hypothetical protein ACS0TY_021082 [Phlomoides rotata]